MNVWAIIPAKAPHDAKTRLAPVLDAAGRARLARRLLAGTVSAALACPALDGIVVVSASAELRRIARELGALAVADPAPVATAGDPLNAALEHACRVVADHGATAALILAADLPLLSADTIAEFMDEAGDAPVAIAPDRRGAGTNALLLRPPSVLRPAFGLGSYLRHVTLARERGAAVATIRLPALAFDLDTPADLKALGLGLSSAREHCYD